MSEALRRIVEALGDGGEEETAAVLRALGAQSGRRGSVQETLRTPLPPPGDATAVHSEVEWV
ncbi:hypothetical protein GR925_00460 [Streptomyces sp. HUCO-GS316]|uniref:hypothetical protein n=1 Tax=Streptomyces sp. HUCO-GS316 TaxID=2692198 RepID=UPI00136D6636|nr:hypothetical protein [Streptomyces sp. HUCO-GS316]MXM61961.1 hypothetical protein [Streptomyces sp. HUCO-GS316]